MTFKDYLDIIKPKIDERIEFIVTVGLVDPSVIPLLLKGKRLRGGLLMLVYESISRGDNYNDALDLACAIELTHSASLILDDMIDEDDERRGLPTFHLTHGHKKTMLETIGILSLPYDLTSRTGTPYVSMLADTQRHMALGVVKELFGSPDMPASKLYDMIIIHKTGRLFSMAAKWGCMVAFGLPEGTPGTDKFGKYGMHCGKAMQIADDITDLYKIMDGERTSNFGSEVMLPPLVGMEETFKNIMSNLKNGEFNLSKIKKPKDAINDALLGMQSKEVEKATSCIDEMSHWYNISHENKERLKTAPHDIVKAMKGEYDNQKQSCEDTG